jgi:hypothetical protein
MSKLIFNLSQRKASFQFEIFQFGSEGFSIAIASQKLSGTLPIGRQAVAVPRENFKTAGILYFLVLLYVFYSAP